jgi:AraC-like DNA-binding protein
MEVVTYGPHPALLPFVELYRLRVVEAQPVSHLVFPSRNSQFIEFYLADPAQVKVDPKSEFRAAPETVLVGTQSKGRVELLVGGSVRTLTVIFRPTGFHQLFGVPMTELAGKGECANSVLGAEIALIRERLLEAPSTSAMKALLDDWLIRRVNSLSAKPNDCYQAIEHSIARVKVQRDFSSVDALAEHSGYGLRHFERVFKLAIGVSPKHYLRVERLQEALSTKSLQPDTPWGVIASDLGFYDQMHLVHEFKALGGAAPSRLFEEVAPRLADLKKSKIYY